MRLSLRLTLFFSLFGLAIAGGLQYSYFKTLHEESYALTEGLAEGTANAIKALVAAQVRAGGLLRLGRDLEDMVRQSGIATVVIKDKKGRRILGRSDDARWLSREPHPGVPISRVPDGIYDVEKPVFLRELGMGRLLIGFHTQSLEERLKALKVRFVRFGVMAVLAIGLAAWLMGTWFGLRLERLLPRLEDLSRNPERFRSLKSAAGNDEVSRLVAAFNRMGESLKLETRRRRELELEKQELASMLVHDLKTPLTVIRSGLALLREQWGEKPIEQGRKHSSSGKRTFELLELSAVRLQRMVEDVLQLSRMEEVEGLRERAPVDMAAMARACAKDFELVAAERRQKIVVDLPHQDLPSVSGDAVLLRRVLDNLVHNAVEHTPSGGQIAIRAASSGASLKVSVSDSGPGVPPEARAEIFRKFFQKDLKRHVGNVGLGLALCEKVVRRHGGSIHIEDAKPRGACFYFLLPVSEPTLPLGVPDARAV